MNSLTAMSKKRDLSSLRKDFPMLAACMHGKPLIYLDTAATAQKPQVVIDAMTNFYQQHYGTVHRTIYDLSAMATQQYEETREKAKRFLNAASTTEIIFTKGTTDAINLVAHSFGKAFIKENDEVIISEMEHHSNIVPWQLMCEERNAILKIIPINEKAELDLDAFRKLLSSKTKLVSLAHIYNSTGTLNPIKAIAKMAHQSGAKILIDGAQSAPHMPIDVQDLDVDFYAFSGHKLYGPTGIGILYGKESLLDAMPPYQGGGDMVKTVTLNKTVYNSLPLKFEAGTPPIAQVIGLGAALDYLSNIDMAAIAHKEQALLNEATAQLSQITEIRLLGTAKEKGAILSFIVEGVHALDIGSLLDLKGIAIRTGNLCAQPTLQRFGLRSVCRASFGLYSTMEEVHQFVKSLQTTIETLK